MAALPRRASEPAFRPRPTRESWPASPRTPLERPGEVGEDGEGVDEVTRAVRGIKGAVLRRSRRERLGPKWPRQAGTSIGGVIAVVDLRAEAGGRREQSALRRIHPACRAAEIEDRPEAFDRQAVLVMIARMHRRGEFPEMTMILATSSVLATRRIHRACFPLSAILDHMIPPLGRRPAAEGRIDGHQHRFESRSTRPSRTMANLARVANEAFRRVPGRVPGGPQSALPVAFRGEIPGAGGHPQAESSAISRGTGERGITRR